MKNKVLQKYVLLEQNKELSLVLDCKIHRALCMK